MRNNNQNITYVYALDKLEGKRLVETAYVVESTMESKVLPSRTDLSLKPFSEHHEFYSCSGISSIDDLADLLDQHLEETRRVGILQFTVPRHVYPILRDDNYTLARALEISEQRSLTAAICAHLPQSP